MQRNSFICIFMIASLIVGTINAQSVRTLGIVTINMEGVVPIITFGDLVIELAEHIGMAALKQVVEENGYGHIELTEYPADDEFRSKIFSAFKNDSHQRITLNMYAEPENLETYATEYELDKLIVIVNPKVGIATFQTNEKYNKDGWGGYYSISLAAASAIVFTIDVKTKSLSVLPKVARGFDFCTWVTITDRPRVIKRTGNFWSQLAGELVEKTIDSGIKEMTKPSKTPKVLKENAIHNAAQEAHTYIARSELFNLNMTGDTIYEEPPKIKRTELHIDTLLMLDFTPLPHAEPREYGKIINWHTNGCDNNPYYKNSIRFLYEGSTLTADFEIASNCENAELIVVHLSSYSKECPGSGFSPITIKINEKVLVENFDPAEHHNYEHGYVTDRWNVGKYLRKGKNTITWIANELCTHYWLQKFILISN